MEIERKWLVAGWPEGRAPETVYDMDQGYISVRPTVRIRRESAAGGGTQYILCFKGKGGLSREEIETPIDAALFSRLCALIGCPLIHKERRDYPLGGGLTLEVTSVDKGAPTAFFYAEVEFSTEEAARAWSPADAGLAGYLADEVTARSGVSMGAYWERTRHGAL